MVEYDAEFVLFGKYSIVKDNKDKYWVKREYLLTPDVFYDPKPKKDFRPEDSDAPSLSDQDKERIKQKVYDLNKDAFVDIWGRGELERFGGDAGKGYNDTPVSSANSNSGSGNSNVNNDDLVNAVRELKAVYEQKAGSNPYEEEIVNAIINKGKKITQDSLLKEFSPIMDEYIRDTYGYLPKKIDVTDSDKPVVQLEGLFHQKFDTILQIVKRNVPLMLVGPAGSGKNHTLEQIAKALSLDFYFTNAVTQEYKLTGFIDANGKYQETQFYRAFKDGGLFFLDEMDASVPEVLVLLNAAIANGYFDFPTGRVNAHEDFRIVSAANTVGRGANMEYTGRSQLDAATLDRFTIVQFDYDPEVEYALAGSTDLYNFVNDLRDIIKNNSIRYVVSMRATINSTKLMDVLSKEELINDVILKGIDEDDKNIIAHDIADDSSNEFEIVFKDMMD